MDTPDLDDLLRRARRHESDALDELVQRYSPRVFGLLYRLTGVPDIAEDLLQETFLRVVRTIGQYEHVGKFESWLFRIAANLARDRARTRSRRGNTISLDGSDNTGTPPVPDDSASAADPRALVERAEAGQRVVAALERLSEAEKEIILLRHYSELSFKEIATLLGIPLGTALARAHRALKHLRTALEEEDA